MAVVPYFELHIRPMFRAIDRDHMLWKLDLSNYDEVVELAHEIALILRKAPPNHMPTKAAGGPWPEGWIQVFESWIATGCKRLLRTNGQYSARRLGDGQVILSVKVQLQNGAEDTWLERAPSALTQAEYTLLLRPAPDGVQEPARMMLFEEVLAGPIDSIVLNDTSGRHDVPIGS
jgi:hypothetical protein